MIWLFKPFQKSVFKILWITSIIFSGILTNFFRQCTTCAALWLKMHQDVEIETLICKKMSNCNLIANNFPKNAQFEKEFKTSFSNLISIEQWQNDSKITTSNLWRSRLETFWLDCQITKKSLLVQKITNYTEKEVLDVEISFKLNHAKDIARNFIRLGLFFLLSRIRGT